MGQTSLSERAAAHGCLAPESVRAGRSRGRATHSHCREIGSGNWIGKLAKADTSTAADPRALRSAWCEAVERGRLPHQDRAHTGRPKTLNSRYRNPFRQGGFFRKDPSPQDLRKDPSPQDQGQIPRFRVALATRRIATTRAAVRRSASAAVAGCPEISSAFADAAERVPALISRQHSTTASTASEILFSSSEFIRPRLQCSFSMFCTHSR